MRGRLRLLCPVLATIVLVGTTARRALGQDCSVSTTIRVLDNQLHPVANITADQLEAEIGSTPARISSISQTAKPTVILMLDASGSMRATWNQSIAAAKQLVGMAEDIDTFVFQDKIHGYAIGRPESEKLLERLSTPPAMHPRTSLYDSLIEVADRVKTRNAAIVVISDGEDNASTHLAHATASLFSRSSWPPVFALILGKENNGDSDALPAPRYLDMAPLASRRNLDFLEVPSVTGGLVVYSPSASKVPATMEGLAAAVLSPFVLTLKPSTPLSKPARLKVRVAKVEGKPGPDFRIVHVAEVAGCDGAPGSSGSQH